jgi:regulator of RNase E activity RraA
MIQKIDLKLLEQFKMLDTTSLSDALDRFGIYGAFLGLKAVVPGTTICGQAFTVQYALCTGAKETAMDYLDDVEPGQVVVLDNAGRETCTVWGDLMSRVAIRNGVAGTVIDGVCRDVPDIRKMAYPIFTKDYFTVTGKERVYLEAVNVPIFICGVKVNPGDIIVADDTGVIAIPLSRAEEVLQAALEIAEKEKVIEGFINEGMTLKEAREKTGYYFLQSRASK